MKRKPAKKMNGTSIRFDPDLYKEIKKRAEADSRTFGAYVCLAVRAYMVLPRVKPVKP